ncbi:MAG: phosphodiesterase [Syntrophaceae bacterium PtaU1.Bin231]|nr:MAG: phosphodiesterase [Syntrophaceae bacterium PtaU1.Bin231]HOG18708.1 HDOD domain-containing protein [Syntrophales bacterium]
MPGLDIRNARNRIENISALPTVPGTLKRISGIIEKPRLALEEISRFVASDPALTSKVLKMVNSAVYGFPGRISSVPHAIMLLGLNVVKGLLLGVSVFDIMQKVMGGLWEHSVACAVVSRSIAEKMKVKDPEEVSVSGLLHDMGKVILMLEYQEQYQEAMRSAESRQLPISQTEKEIFQETHAAVGMWLSQKWRFPANLVEAMAYHHSPSLAKIAPMETAVVHLADGLVRARGVGFAGDPFVPAVDPAAFDLLGLSDGDIRDVLAALEKSIEQDADLSLT